MTGVQDQQEVEGAILSAEGLGDNGGQTLTVPLASASLAIDAGSAQCPAFDQRGTARPQGGACDIGAFESTTGTPLSIPSSDTVTVTTLADHDDGFCDEDCTLREAVMYSSAGNTVNFADGLSGVINLESTISIDHALSIHGPGSAQLSISGQANHTLFYVDIDMVVTISGVTMMNGYDNDDDGGLIYSDGSLSVSHANLQGAYAEGSGGAIASYGPVLSLNDVVVSGNRSDSHGGAVYTQSDIFSVVSSTFVGNVSDQAGGALYLAAGDIQIAGATFSTNQSAYGGGAMYIEAVSNVVVTSTSFTGNKTESGVGGAIDQEADRLTVIGSTFDGNVTRGGNAGGAIYGDGIQLVVSSSTFTGNVSPSGLGGAIYTCQDASIDRSIFTGNASPYASGGAIYHDSCNSSLEVSASTFQANASGEDGGAIYAGSRGVTIDATTFSNNAALSGIG
ncbi:CSLREA domain-containing protein, partial [bacterium]|nr:CSLREA domain-containing protein [bacterium]